MENGYVLSSQEITELVENGIVFSKDSKINPNNIKPASLELCLGDEAYELESAFLPEANKSIFSQIKKRSKRKFSLNNSGILELKKAYALPLNTSFDLTGAHPVIHAKFNPRSRMGRLDFFLRVCLDKVPFFDQMPRGYRGDAFVIAEPYSFPIKAFPGIPLVQVRFMVGNPVLSDLDIRKRMNVTKDLILYSQDGQILYSSNVDIRNGLTNTINLKGELIGFKAKKEIKTPINLTNTVQKKENKEIIGTGHKVLDYFNPITESDLKDNRLIIEPDVFYILQTSQRFEMAKNLCADIAHSDASIGEFRSHYAGFIDPGFEGTITLEMRSDRCEELRHRQPICRTIYEKMKENTKVNYGNQIGSAHFGQSHPNPGAYFNQLGLISLLNN